MDTSSICDTIQPDPGASVAEQIVALAHQLDQHIRGHLDCQLAEFDLTGPQALLLRQLDAPLRMQEVANRLLCDPSNVTGIVDRLERRGLVQRRVLPADRRVKELVLTPDGKRVQQCLVALLDTIPAIAGLSEDDRQELRDLLRRALAAGDPAVVNR